MQCIFFHEFMVILLNLKCKYKILLYFILKYVTINQLIMIIDVGDNIVLKQIELSDAEEIFQIIDSQRDYLGEWLSFAKSAQLSDTEGFVKSVVNAPKNIFEYAFTIRKSDEFVGIIRFRHTDRLNKKTEIGYWLSEKHQEQGIVTKSVQKLCEFAFSNMDINRIQIKCAVNNLASIKIPIRLGFIFEGIERQGELLYGNVFTDVVVYSKLKSDN